VTATIHPTAEVHPDAVIGDGCRIWHQAQVREGAALGPGCIIGKGAYIGEHVSVGANCKVQNYACLYPGVSLEDGVFIGPHVVFTNDRLPRAITPDGSLKSDADWQIGPTLVRYGASLGSRAVVLPGLSIGRWSLVGAGAVVTKDVPHHALVVGNPARRVGWVCVCAATLSLGLVCGSCGRSFEMSIEGLQPAGAPVRP
jgi:acetyltransferase-like isoleucine patch superfamily enzyme